MSGINIIKPFVNIIVPKASAVLKPKAVQITREEISKLKYASNPIDRVELSTRKREVGIDEVKSMFPMGKMNENNFLINSIKDLIGRLETKRKIIDLTPELSNAIRLIYFAAIVA